MRPIDGERLISGLADWQLTVKDHSLWEAIDECIKAIAEQPVIDPIGDIKPPFVRFQNKEPVVINKHGVVIMTEELYREMLKEIPDTEEEK